MRAEFHLKMIGPNCAAMFNLLNTHTLKHRRGPMRVAWNDLDYRARLRGHVQINKCTHTYAHTHTHTKSKKRRKERVGPVAANPDNLKNNKVV